MEEMKNYASKWLAVDAGIKASGGLEIALPMAARIRLSQADLDDFFERLG